MSGRSRARRAVDQALLETFLGRARVEHRAAIVIGVFGREQAEQGLEQLQAALRVRSGPDARLTIIGALGTDGDLRTAKQRAGSRLERCLECADGDDVVLLVEDD